MLKSSIINEYLSLSLIKASNLSTDYVVIKIGTSISKNDVKILKEEKNKDFAEFFKRVTIKLTDLEEFAVENDLDIKFCKRKLFPRSFMKQIKRVLSMFEFILFPIN